MGTPHLVAMHCRDLCVLILNVAILACAGIGICGMYGTDIVWSTVSDISINPSVQFSGDIKFGLIKFQTEISGSPLKWLSYQECSSQTDVIMFADLYDMCHDCDTFGKVSLGFTGAVVVLGLISVCQLVCACGRPAMTMALAGFASLFAVCAWSVCYVRLIYLFDRTEVDGQYQYNNTNVPTLQAGSCAMIAAMIFSWFACCCARRHHIEIIREIYHEQPLIQPSMVYAAEPQTEYHRQYRQEVTAAPEYQDLPPQKLRCWQEFTNSDGQTYYFNPATQQSQWKPPGDD